MIADTSDSQLHALDKMNQLCKVCGEPAAGYHFGAFTCEGCKSFFGRTYNNLAVIGECKNSGQCVINKKNRTSCKSCRLKKCLLVGMSKSGSRYGRRSNWFKIHCLIQDQAEMSSRLADQGVLGNGQLPYDTKDMMFNFRPEYSENSSSHLPDVNGRSSRESPSSDPGTLETTASSPLGYRFYNHQKSSTNGFSNGYSGRSAGLDASSPTYERKENVGFHHQNPHLPLSPVSPLHHSKFFHHATNNTFFAKTFTNTMPKIFPGDLRYSPPHRLLTVPTGMMLNSSGHHLHLQNSNTILRAPRECPIIGTECYPDLPEQETPIDLSIKKPETPTSDDTIVDKLEDEDEYINMDDNEDGNGSPRRPETPLDLTSKKSVSCWPVPAYGKAES